MFRFKGEISLICWHFNGDHATWVILLLQSRMTSEFLVANTSFFVFSKLHTEEKASGVEESMTMIKGHVSMAR